MVWNIRAPNFQTLHYGYIITCSILGLIILYPSSNLAAVDAFFFGASASTESGLNTINVNDLRTYQQLFIYFIPILTNIGFINIMVVGVRLHWFEKHLKKVAPSILKPNKSASRNRAQDPEGQESGSGSQPEAGISTGTDSRTAKTADEAQCVTTTKEQNGDVKKATQGHDDDVEALLVETLHRNAQIAFDTETQPRADQSKTLYIPSPGDRERGHQIAEIDDNQRVLEDTGPDVGRLARTASRASSRYPQVSLTRATSLARVADVASSMFIVGAGTTSPVRQRRPAAEQMKETALPILSSQVTIGRNSQFYNLTSKDREQLGGIEYKSLKLLLKIIIAYFFGLHLFGAVCLVAWIRTQSEDSKYVLWLQQCGQDKIWWAFYSSQTMVSNLGFTLTPDSMMTFRDAVFPLLLMSFLALAGNTFYPIFLRLSIQIMFWLVPKGSSLKAPLEFLLMHPRRCFTHLFPSRPTWILFAILFILNAVDIILIITLDLHNTAVNDLRMGPRVVAAIFQAANSRHTGGATFNIAAVNPAVQFSLLVMMYIAAYPIATSIRASNMYEERSLGVYHPDPEVDDNTGGRSYFLRHLQNQLSFDLWYIFLGVFCICVSEADLIMDPNQPSFAIFPIFFEVVSAYGNVGLSLGDPSVYTSLSGLFRPFSKVVICFMMIRGRHRGLPYQLDRAIMLPRDHEAETGDREERFRCGANTVKRDTFGKITMYKTV